MSNSRWLQELTKTYVGESVGQPANLNEQIIQEQQDYISVLESVIVNIAEQMGVEPIDLLEEDSETISEIFDSPKGQQALNSYMIKAKDSLGKARTARAEAEDDANEIFFQDYNARLGHAGGARPRSPDGAEIVNARRAREGAGTVEDAQKKAKAAFDTIQKRKAGLKLAGRRQEKIDAKKDARMDAEAKALGIDRFNKHMRDGRGFVVANPYYKERSVEDTPPDIKLPGKK